MARSIGARSSVASRRANDVRSGGPRQGQRVVARVRDVHARERVADRRDDAVAIVGERAVEVEQRGERSRGHSRRRSTTV